MLVLGKMWRWPKVLGWKLGNLRWLIACHIKFQLNSLASGKFEWNLRNVKLRLILLIDGWGISCELALRWMSLDLNEDKSTLVQVMVWCRQATSHYLSQCWPRSLSPYGVTRPQWVKWRSCNMCKKVTWLDHFWTVFIKLFVFFCRSCSESEGAGDVDAPWLRDVCDSRGWWWWRQRCGGATRYG